MINFVSTLAKGLIILAAITVMWETARNLWLNWGTSYFWASSLVAAVIGVLFWWGIGLAAYLTAPGKADKSSETQHASVTQSATASGGSVINQAGRDQIINMGISESTVRKILADKAVPANTELAKKYPLGCILLGITDGTVIFKPKSTVWRFDPGNEVRIRIDQDEKIAEIIFVFFKLSGIKEGQSEGFTLENCTIQFPYVENVPKALKFGWTLPNGATASLFVEVLDTVNKIFVLGLKES